MDVNANCIIEIYEASRARINHFCEILLNENLFWLQEVLDEAKKEFISDETITLLPKTPGIKRKRPVLSQQIDENDHKQSPAKCSSTFMEEAESKKLKIDDMSTIIEANDTLNDTQRTLRPRKKKSAPRPLTKSKRIMKTRASNLKKSIENRSLVVLDTPSPEINKKSTIKKSENTVINDTITSPLKSTKKTDSALKDLSPTKNYVQPHVASIIEQLKLSTQKSAKTNIQPTSNVLDELKTTLFGEKLSEEQSLAAFSPIVALQKCSVSTPISPKANEKVSTEVDGNSMEETEELVDNTMEEDKEMIVTSPGKKEGNGDSGISSDEKHDAELDNKSPDKPDEEPQSKSNGRRDTYKVMVQEAELPSVENAKVQLFNPVHNSVTKVVPSMHMNDASPDLIQRSNTSSANRGPKIVKPFTSKNLVSGVKSFINRTMTPPRKTKEEIQQKKEKELEQKELQRQKAVEESNLRRQRIMEFRKKQRMEREKRLAEQQALRQEEEEKKRKQMEARNKKIMKNREEIRKQRELEDKKKREIREQKNAVAEARRLKEEEEHQRKVRDQIEEEERRCEMLKKKAEYEEQERLKKRQQAEKEEKERLRLLEKEKQLHEERKLRELLEKEKHREEVERKLKEDKEKERIERQKQEQRLRQAELEIAEANRKRELEIEKNKMKTQASIVQQTSKIKHYSPSAGKENHVKGHKNMPLIPKQPIVKCQKINVALPPLKLRQSSYTSYDIDDLNSDDSTDDESEPTKRVPSWAQGMELKTQLMHQFYANVDPDDIFVNCMEPCRLDKIFQRNKERYFKRTSSAHWDSPLLKTKLFRS